MRAHIGPERALNALGVIVLAASLAIVAIGVLDAPPERLPAVLRHCLHKDGGYCGCPNKEACAFDDSRDCGGCCAPNKCLMSPAERP